MKAITTTLLILLISCTLGAVIQETASLKNFLLGTEPNCAYDRWVSHVAEGIVTPGYNTYAPYDRQLSGFGDYITPSSDQLSAWGNIVDLFLAGQLDLAQTAIDAASFPYQVVQFTDTSTGRLYYMLREIPNSQYIDDNNTADAYDDEIGAFAYGWGLYIYNPQGNRPIIVTAPHPCDDFPTPSFAYQTFTILNAKFLLIAGAGREVRWTNVAPYTNSKSLSDPTRVTNHPYNTCYKKFADQIRTEFNTREFSAQIHTYDWNYHNGYPNTQISAGYNKMCPNLPIRDLSSLKHDLINQGTHLMIPANTIGIHNDVYLHDFYSVNYSVHPFTFDDGEQSYPVNDYIDLPAYSQNYQMLYTLSGWNDYDTYDPFFHMEMDELPNCYDQTENTYKWFYGWDEMQQRWNFSALDQNFNRYFLRWVYHLDEVLDEVFVMNDELVPPAPTALRVQNNSLTSITLAWNKSDSYDFYSYEVLYATEPITESNYTIFDRGNAALLASPDCESITVTGLNNANTYFFAIRAKDKNGNVSPLSNEINTIPAPANIYSFTAHGVSNAVRLSWSVSGQTNNQGFKLYRKVNDNEFALLDSYETNPALINPTAGTFEYWDNSVSNGTNYSYMVSSTNTGGIEFYYNYPASARPLPIHTLYFRDNNSIYADSIAFAQNPYASDGQDSYYDISKNNPSGSNYVWMSFWQPYWGNQGTQLQREVKGGYEPALDVKTWSMRVRSTEVGTPLFISASDTFDRAQKLYLYDSGAGVWHNLFAAPYQFTVANSNIRTMTLYYGNLQPRVVHGSQNNRLYQGGNQVTFYWSNQNSFLIDHLDLYIKSEADSLLLASGLPNTQSSFSYIFPPNIDIQNARLMIDCHAVDGLISNSASSYVFGIVPSMNMHYNEEGWQTRSSIWATESFPLNNVFGAGCNGFIPGDGGAWMEEDDLLPATPYWINAAQINFFSSTATVNTTEQSFALVPGWNFVPNPHLCEYPVKSLRFTVNSTLFRYSEMINQKLVSRSVFVYRQGGFRAVDKILPYESFYIKYYGSESLSAQINFYPYFAATDISPSAADWEIKVQVSGSDQDEFVIGAHTLATDGYDFSYDLPSAPPKPFPSLRCYLTREAAEDADFWDHRLYSEFREPFAFIGEYEKTWLFRLSTSTADSVVFNLSSLNLPVNYSVRIYVNGQGWTYSESPSFVFYPAALGSYDGMIKVNNHPVATDDLVNSPISKLQVYPNPFNPSTTIAFSSSKAQETKVELYNLKGQRVRTLYSGFLPTGSHKLVWDGKDNHGRGVGSGIYFALVKGKTTSQTIKMVLMK
ncbi:hypothetical protein MASR1M36_04730 [Candidatus Cloacimonadaceae bacterium]